MPDVSVRVSGFGFYSLFSNVLSMDRQHIKKFFMRQANSGSCLSFPLLSRQTSSAFSQTSVNFISSRRYRAELAAWKLLKMVNIRTKKVTKKLLV